MRINLKTVVIIASIALSLGSSRMAEGAPALLQDPQQPYQAPVAESPDPIEQLHLTPDQLQRIRAINRQLRDERAAINQHLRESNRALQDALDAEKLDENLLADCMREVSAAQAAQLRMRIQTEVRIRSVLSPEQLATLRSNRAQAQDLLRERQQQNQRRRPAQDGLRPNQRNGIAPLFPRPTPTPRPARP